MRNVRTYDVGLWLVRVVSLAGLVLSLTGIYALTEQSVEGTSALSGSVGTVAEGIVSRVEDVAPDEGASAVSASVGEGEAAGAADASEAARPAADDATPPSSRRPGPVALYVRENVRRLAHVAEFASVGLFSALAAWSWLGVRRRPGAAWGTPQLVAAALAFCVAASLFDQTHKLFVPGRHFDVLDLPFDAAGYLVGIAVVFAVRALVLRGARRGGAHLSPAGRASA